MTYAFLPPARYLSSLDRVVHSANYFDFSVSREQSRPS